MSKTVAACPRFESAKFLEALVNSIMRKIGGDIAGSLGVGKGGSGPGTRTPDASDTSIYYGEALSRAAPRRSEPILAAKALPHLEMPAKLLIF
jgi:hypothetical protein